MGLRRVSSGKLYPPGTRSKRYWVWQGRVDGRQIEVVCRDDVGNKTADRLDAIAFAARFRDVARRVREKNAPPPSIVYFIEAAGIGIKIGTTTNLDGRIKTLATASGVRLEVLATIEGDIEAERRIQHRFRHLRLRGEWYRPDADLMAYIDDLRAFAREQTDVPRAGESPAPGIESS